ncbi:MAG TPA: IS1595 family transposase [Chitinophagales bacterium]|nr:IS1595 family transposase [Chitinophagales bacterium]
MKLQEIFKKYSTEHNAKLAFKLLRDKQGIVCKKCKHNEHYWKADKWQYECKRCGFRTTLRSGTIMESSKLLYRYWMIAMGLITATKKSFSALEIQRQLDHKRYEPIWFMLYKIRVAMGRRDDKYKLDGFIEIDEGFFEGHQISNEEVEDDRYIAYQNKGKRQVKVLVAVESEPASVP